MVVFVWFQHLLITVLTAFFDIQGYIIFKTPVVLFYFLNITIYIQFKGFKLRDLVGYFKGSCVPIKQ